MQKKKISKMSEGMAEVMKSHENNHLQAGISLGNSNKIPVEEIYDEDDDDNHYESSADLHS